MFETSSCRLSVCNPGSSFTHSTEDQIMDRQHVGMCTSFPSRYFLLKERRDVQVLKADSETETDSDSDDSSSGSHDRPRPGWAC